METEKPLFTADQINLIRRTMLFKATADEQEVFLNQCHRTKLDPFSRQIYPQFRYNRDLGCEVMQVQISIDGLRLTAERTGRYEGQTPVMWCGTDGLWKDVWLEKDPPAAARVGVYKQGFREALYTVARWGEYVQTTKQGVSLMWIKMGALMLSKCAESLALRKAFPQELSGLYTTEEMQQAEVEAAQEVSPEEEKYRKTMRANRGKFNQAFLNAKTLQELADKRIAAEKFMQLGPKLWETLTHHNSVETFGSLYDEHKARLDNEAAFNGSEGVKNFIAKIRKCGTTAELAHCADAYRNMERWNGEHEIGDALHEAALAMGLSGLQDLEEDGTDESETATAKA